MWQDMRAYQTITSSPCPHINADLLLVSTQYSVSYNLQVKCLQTHVDMEMLFFECGTRSQNSSAPFSYTLQNFFFQWLFQPIQVPGLRNHFSDGRTPWASDQPAARPLPTHRTTQTQNKRIHTSNIHALSGIRTHDPSVRASEDMSPFITIYI
jgi:hypothetical protein